MSFLLPVTVYSFPIRREKSATSYYHRSFIMEVKAYLEITMRIDNVNRPAAAKVYTDYRAPFLDTIEGALTKELLIRDEDVQVLHGFDTVEHAAAYLNSELFNADVVKGLKPLWSAEPDVKIYTVA